ncbi:MAG: hypothetical protein K2X11_21345 [Acetobacteraceae bacterium]|nr:hypothetical protein [Acetobacteraceae bacterium]
MLLTIRQSRLARLLAVLAVAFVVGLGQHVHAAELMERSAPAIAALDADGGDEDGKAVPAEAHCAVCHLARAMMPDAAEPRAPSVLHIARGRSGQEARPDLATPEGPSRPPRRPHPA